MNKILVSLFFFGLLFTACNEGENYKYKADTSKIDYNNIEIKQYQKDIFNIDQNNLRSELVRLAPEYPLFIDPNPDTLQQIRLLQYLNDPLLLELYSDSEEKFKELGILESQLTDAYKHLKYYYPDTKEKDFYTYISGIDFTQPVYVDPNNVIISLDMYYGRDYDAYRKAGIPQYKANSFDPEFIPYDIMYMEAYEHMNKDFLPKTLLDFMIHEAKAVLFCDLMMPYGPDTLKMKYSTTELEWCQENEANIWAFFIENNLLYETDREHIQKLILEAPYTKGFSEESPGRLGIWTGWNILKAYMQKNKNVSLQQLMMNTDSQSILQKSGYRP
jgi:hypothetical protein